MTKNIDFFVDYEAEYADVLEKVKIAGEELTALCPFHEDKHPSFSANLRTGQWHCFACGEQGNFQTFWAKLHHVDSQTAFQEICQKYGRWEDPAQHAGARRVRPNPDGLLPYTLEQYAAEKGIPVDFLSEQFGLSTMRGSRGWPDCLKIPYWNTDGQPVATRKRYGVRHHNQDKFRWQKGNAGKIPLYNEWSLPQIRSGGWAILTEGESDVQTLAYLGFPALGAAGATNFNEKHAQLLHGLKRLYVHIEPDKGGATFHQRVMKQLRAVNWMGELYCWRCSDIGFKDPSDVFIQLGREDGTAAINKLLRAAEPVDFLEELRKEETIPGAPIQPQIPDGYTVSLEGIFKDDPKKGKILVCKTPIIFTRRLKNVETREEKIEIAFYLDRKWNTVKCERTTVFSRKNIVELTALGLAVHSENAKDIVQFLGALEAANIDSIPIVETVSAYGWQPEGRFFPGKEDELVLDENETLQQMAAGFSTNGTLEDWIAAMRPHRERDKFRFILAASFAAPLLKLLKRRSFLVYNWGDSRGGKTAALKAALSVWGDPDALMVNFNTTMAGLERVYAFCRNLPVGVDEWQLANKDDREKIVYMVSEGKGKTRATKNIGIRPALRWCTITLSTGEQPISSNTSMTGLATRTLEVFGTPFASEADAARMHQSVSLHFGHAGRKFIEELTRIKTETISIHFDLMMDMVRRVDNGRNSAHIAEAAVVALADCLVSEWLFGEAFENAMERAERMVQTILDEETANGSRDVNENAVEYIRDWIREQWARFETFDNDYHTPPGPCYGFTCDADGTTVYVIPSSFDKALKDGGFDPEKSKRYMAERGVIDTSIDKGKLRYSVQKRYNSKKYRVVAVHMEPMDGQNPAPNGEQEELYNDGLPPLYEIPHSAEADFPAEW